MKTDTGNMLLYCGMWAICLATIVEPIHIITRMVCAFGLIANTLLAVREFIRAMREEDGE